MSIGITDEHEELAASLRKWAASLGALDAVRAAESDAGARFDEVWAAVDEMGVASIAVPESAGTLPTNTPLFAGLLVGVVVIVVGLTYFPVVALGPLVEHLAQR